MQRIDIRAPQDGVVHQTVVHTVGGVISAGEQLMLIVPKSEKLIAELKVAPHDIDQLWIGQRQICGSQPLTNGPPRR
jgi:HlyD family secretion protein